MATKKVILKDLQGNQLIPNVGIPSQTGNEGKVLGTNGESLEFVEKQDTLVSGTNIKTINNQSLLGSGDIEVSYTAGAGIDITNDVISVDGVQTSEVTLATVATSGSYDDLSNKPTIPTVNNATLTIQKNGTTVNTFTANASSDVTANITVPTQASDIGAQATLVSGTNIKTINNQSLLGSGDIEIGSSPTWSYDSTTETLTIS